MKKKKAYIGIISIVLLTMIMNLNTYKSSHNNHISLSNIEVMTNAAAENYCAPIIGYFCYKFESGDSYCTSGTVWETCT